MANSKAKKFQTIMLVVFGGIFVFAILVFSQIIPIGRSNQTTEIAGRVTIWGSLPQSYLQSMIDTLEDENDTLSITYEEKNEATFDRELIEALAVGQGPDLFILPHDKILQYQDKVTPIPYDRYPRQAFQSRYVDMADLLLSDQGVLGLPFILDPLVMYYNKNLLASRFIVEPPEYWDEFFSFSEQVTEAASVSVDLSAVALGSFDNINHAKDLLSAMFMQTRNPITQFRRNRYLGTLPNDFSTIRDFSAQTLDFYTSFTDPTKTHYSWNTGMASSRDAFLAEDLALYFGYATEARTFLRTNPNINVGVAVLPQMRDMPKVTYATMQSFALNRASRNPMVALQVMQSMTDERLGLGLSLGLQVPPVFTNRLSIRPTDEVHIKAFYDSAIIANAWLDPDAAETEAGFRRMVRDVNAGLLPPESAIVRLNQVINDGFEQLAGGFQLGNESVFDE